MLHVYAVKFNVIENLKNFINFFFEPNKASVIRFLIVLEIERPAGEDESVKAEPMRMRSRLEARVQGAALALRAIKKGP